MSQPLTPAVRLSSCMAPTFYPVHLDICARRHAEIWLRGGRGSAKSSFASLEIILGLMREPDVHAIVYRKVAATLRESVYEQMLWAIETLGVSRYFRAKLSPLEIEYIPTGQRVLFRGADDPAKSKSIKQARGHFGWLWFEELTEFGGPDELRTIRAGVIRGAEHAVTLCTYNPPQSMKSWVNAEALVPRPSRLVHTSSYLDLPPEWLGRAFLDEAERLRVSNERAYRHMYLGEITGTGGRVFENLELRPLTDEEQRAGRAYRGLDFGFAVDPDAYISCGYDPRTKRLWLLDEFYQSRVPADALAQTLRQRCGRETLYCDSADPRMIAHLRANGVNAFAVKKGPGSVAAGLRWLQERSAIVIDPERCPNAARELSAYEYARAPDGRTIAEFPDRDNHAIDALRYATEGLSRERRAMTSS